jgi:hypothetical protein
VLRRLLPGVVLIAAWTLSAPRASAQASTVADRATARALAHEGSEAQHQGRYAFAADRFERAEALVHAPTLLLGLARAQVGLGKLVEANETYQRILREPLARGAPVPFVKAVEDAGREDVDVAARLAWVTLMVTGPASPRVLLDDTAVPIAALGVRFACNPGAHAVKVTAEGFAGAEQSFVIGEGAERTLSLTLQPLPPASVVSAVASAASATPSASEPATAPERPSSFQTTAGFTALGIGIAGLGVGGVAGVLVLNRHATLSDSCPSGGCSPQFAADVDRYRTLANIATAAMIVGATGTVASVILLLTAPKQQSVQVYAAPLGAGLTGRF